jgi:hypothetical protein
MLSPAQHKFNYHDMLAVDSTQNVFAAMGLLHYKEAKAADFGPT